MNDDFAYNCRQWSSFEKEMIKMSDISMELAHSFYLQFMEVTRAVFTPHHSIDTMENPMLL